MSLKSVNPKKKGMDKTDFFIPSPHAAGPRLLRQSAMQVPEKLNACPGQAVRQAPCDVNIALGEWLFLLQLNILFCPFGYVPDAVILGKGSDANVVFLPVLGFLILTVILFLPDLIFLVITSFTKFLSVLT